MAPVFVESWLVYVDVDADGNWVILLMKVAARVRATENSRYEIFMCCDQKFEVSDWICCQHRWTIILIVLIDMFLVHKSSRTFCFFCV